MSEQTTSGILEKLINPPYGMRGLRNVVIVLRDVLKHAWLIKVGEDSEGREKPEFLDATPKLMEFCSAIADQTETSGYWIEQPDAVQHFMTSHPIYSSLYELSKMVRPLSSGRLQLMAHALVAAHSGTPSMPVDGHRPSTNIIGAFRELRRVNNRVLDALKFELPSRHGCYWALKDAEHSEGIELNRAESEALGHIRRLIGLSLGTETPLEISSRNRAGGRPDTQTEEISPGRLGDDGGETFYLIASPDSEPSVIDAGRLDGLPERDVAPEVRTVVASERANPRRGGSLQRGVYKSRYMVDQQRRGAQALTTRWDRLTEYELYSVISAISWEGAGQNLGALAIGLILLTGRPLEIILNSRLCSTIAQVPGRIADYSLVICREGCFIQVSVPVPVRQRPLRTEWHESLQQTDNQLRLPIVTLLWDLLTEALGNNEGNWQGHLFQSSDIEETKQSVKNLLSDVRSEDGARVTETRLQRCVYHEIADVQGDAVDAVFITGNQPATGGHVGAYYYCVSETDLLDRYLSALREMVPDEFSVLMLPARPCSNRSFLIGSPLCPKPERLEKLVTDLQQRLSADLKKPLSAEVLVDIHNSYTLYVALFLAFGTGYRSVQAPLSRHTDYDPLSGMLVVADKTNSAFSHARLVPVPESLSRQLDLYKQHRESVADQMWAFLRIKEPAHFLFFLSRAASGTKKSEKLVKVIPVNSDTLKARLRGISDLPLNINRHFLRSELRHRGVHAELVDAWMGHWLDGQEPMGRYSTLSPIDFASGIEPGLSEILNEMGWTPKEGMS
jgi:hypothetical protein